MKEKEVVEDEEEEWIGAKTDDPHAFKHLLLHLQQPKILSVYMVEGANRK